MVQPGLAFAGYAVEAVLGRGGQATVYRAHGRRTPAVVALKVLDDHHRDPASVARLAREHRVAGRLKHPHIVRVYEHGPHWMTMQYVDGGNVTGLRSLEYKLAALAQIAGALDHTHRSGIVHADVKPTNILVTKSFRRAAQC